MCLILFLTQVVTNHLLLTVVPPHFLLGSNKRIDIQNEGGKERRSQIQSEKGGEIPRMKQWSFE